MVIIQIKQTFIEALEEDAEENSDLRRTYSAPALLCSSRAEPCSDDDGHDQPDQPAVSKSISPRRRPRRCNVNSGMRSEVDAEATVMTTVILQNVPSVYTRAMLLEMFNSEGFACCYDFVYLPVKFKSNLAFGYAFVNLINEGEAIRFTHHFSEFSRWAMESDKIADVDWSRSHQGLDQQIARYRNSPLLHPASPDHMKPVILQSGIQVPFPEPTENIQMPIKWTPPASAASKMAGALLPPTGACNGRILSWSEASDQNHVRNSRTNSFSSMSTREPSCGNEGRKNESADADRKPGRRARRTIKRAAPVATAVDPAAEPQQLDPSDVTPAVDQSNSI